MPQNPNESSILRQWQLLNHLESRGPGKTVDQLLEDLDGDGYQITKRTVQRDLADLSKVFPLVQTSSTKPYRWYCQDNKRLGMGDMILTEAISLGLVEQIIRQLVPTSFVKPLEDRFKRAKGVLSAFSHNTIAGWSDVTRYLPPGMTFLPPEVVPAILTAIQDSLLQGKQILAEYQRVDSDSVKEMQLQPLALIQQGVRTYLLATKAEEATPYYYALHRFVSVVPLDQPVVVPEGYSLERFLNQGGGQFGTSEIITLKAKVSSRLAGILRETPLEEHQKLEDRKGFYLLTASVVDSWQLRFWLLSQGPRIVVTSPKSLRKETVSMLEAAVTSYASNQPCDA